MAEFDEKKLMKALEEKDVDRADFINKLYDVYNIRKDTARTWFRGARNPKDEAIQQMAQLLNIEPKEIIKEGYLEPITTNRIARIPMLYTYTKFMLDKDVPMGDIIDKIIVEATASHEVITSGNPNKMFALSINEGDMSSPIPSGSIVTCEYGMDIMTEGSVVVIHQQFHIIYLRRVKFVNGEIYLCDLRDYEMSNPTMIGSSERVIAVVKNVEYKTPISRA